jgi:alcohol dehydrogenase
MISHERVNVEEKSMRFHSFRTAKKILFGPGVLTQISEEAKRLGSQKLGIITDPGVTKAGIVDKVAEVLDHAQLNWCIWDHVEPEPSLACGDAAIRYVREEQCDSVIGVGGGSTLDTAKAAAVALTNSGTLKDWIQTVFATPPAPLILVPTTAGTGSEVSNVAIFATPEVKYALYSALLYPDVALVDPELTRTVPPSVTARTGIDALCHAMEAYVSLHCNPITDCLALDAIRFATAHIKEAYLDGDNMDARIGMSYAALLAGLAFGNAGTVLGHASGYAYVYPATPFHFPHGLAIGITMPYVLEYNAVANLQKHATLAELLGGSITALTQQEAAFRCAVDFKQLMIDLDLPTSLQEVNIPRDMIPAIAQNVFKSPQHIARNPRPVLEHDMVTLFTNAYDGTLMSQAS